MIVPFVFSMSTIREAPYLWWFYKGLDFIKQTKSAIIAQEVYCCTMPSEFTKMGRKEAFDKTHVDRLFQYHLPKNRDLKTEHIYEIPDSVLEPLIKEKGSITDAFCYLLGQADERFCSFLDELIDRIEQECEAIEAFVILLANPSLEKVAHSRNIPVINIELGCLRHPSYQDSAFWDLNSLSEGNTVEQRWNRFQKECETSDIPLFSKQECLATLLRKEKMGQLKGYARKPKKKIGVLLGYTTYEMITYRTLLNDSELLFRLKQRYGLENILIRKHPGDPYGGQYPVYAPAMDEPGRAMADFILDCETIISLVSGGAIEAMLYNRKAITLLPAPSYYPAGHEIEGEGKCAGEDFLSFFVFGYMIPAEFLLDVEYIRWRLTMPSEREIYLKHLQFYFQKQGLPEEWINGRPGSRLKNILAAKSG